MEPRSANNHTHHGFDSWPLVLGVPLLRGRLKMRISKKWDIRFIDLAQHIAGFSKDPSTCCGAVIIDDQRRIVSCGYNGFPQGVADDSRLLIRETKYKIIVHAERNAIIFAQRCLKGCTIYTWPFAPCSVCAAMIIQAGIKRVVAPKMAKDKWKRWKEDMRLAENIMREAKVKVKLY
jgi:dCMP deaminase